MLTKHWLRRAKQFAGVLCVTAMTVCLISAGEIAELHQKWIRPKDTDSSKQKERFEALDQPKHGVTEIGIERTACHGTCPIYTFILKADGTVRYVGEEHSRRRGTHTGQISTWQFNRLAEFAIDAGYMNLDSVYDLPTIADFHTTYTTVVVGNKRKLIKNYGDLGPTKLWAFQQAIDSLIAEVLWDGDEKQEASDKAP
jgi:hypothetical protein